MGSVYKTSLYKKDFNSNIANNNLKMSLNLTRKLNEYTYINLGVNYYKNYPIEDNPIYLNSVNDNLLNKDYANLYLGLITFQNINSKKQRVFQMKKKKF